MEALCLCGSQRGYPHGWDCPWPNFTGIERRDFDWMQDRDRLRESYRKAGMATHGRDGWQYGQKAAR